VLQAAHEDLFARYSGAVEQIDSLRTDKKTLGERLETQKSESEALQSESEALKIENAKIQQHRDQLRKQLDAVEQSKRELEEAEPPGPSPLSVSDVLISVTFPGVDTPLQVLPWDTNMDDVVGKWL